MTGYDKPLRPINNASAVQPTTNTQITRGENSPFDCRRKMITHDVIYASRQKFEDLLAEANSRPYEGVTVHYHVYDRVFGNVKHALKAAFAKLQPARKQKPALREDYATQ